MAINVFDSFLKEFEQPITAFVSTSVSNLASYIDGPLRIAVMLYVILYGFAVMRGAISEPIMEFAWRAMRIVVVVLLATNSSTFQQYVTGLFFDSLPKEIGNALAGSGLNTSSGAPFDQLLSKGIDVANKIYDQAGLTNIAPALIAAILLVFVAVGSFLQFAILLYAKVGLGVVIALGPIFIALGLFEATRPFTEAWLRQVANFVILLVLVVALVGLMLTTVSGFIDRFAANAGTAGEMVVAAVAISAVLGLSGYIALQLPIIAGGLAGGGASLASRLVTSPLDCQCHGRSRRRLCRRALVGQPWSRGDESQPAGRQYAAHPIAGDHGRVSKRSPASGDSGKQGHQKMWRRLFIICVIAWQLGGCAIWSKAPPSCDGLARRPLNRSLWDWETGTPLATPEPPIPPSAPAPSSAKARPARQRHPPILAASGRWADIAASYRACGKEA